MFSFFKSKPEPEAPKPEQPAAQPVSSPSPVEPAVATAESRPGWAQRLKQGLAKTRDRLGGQLSGLFGVGRKIDAELFEELETILITADVGVDATQALLDTLQKKVRRENLTEAAELQAALKDALVDLLTPLQAPLDVTPHKPFILMLAGVNGAGKTTTIGMLACLLEPTSGDALIAGASIRRDPMAVRRAIGVVPQEIALYPTLSARENLRFWARMYEVAGEEAARRIEEVLDIVGLRDRAGERIDTYSGGMKRRINIAVGLLHRPKLLMLDEPTVGVDPQSRTNILETVKQLNRDGLTVLYTSHYMEEVEFLCDRIAIMDAGQIIAMGTQEELRLQVGERDLISIATHAARLGAALPASLRALPGVDDVRMREDRLEVLTTTGRRLLPQIVTQFVTHDVPILAIEVREPNLESLFLHLTGRGLRD